MKLFLACLRIEVQSWNGVTPFDIRDNPKEREFVGSRARAEPHLAAPS